jgi:hypothetical protein
VLQSLALSAVIQVLLAPVTIAWIVPIRDRLDELPERVAVWGLLAILIVPVLLGVLGGRLSDWISDPSEPTGVRRLLARLLRTTTPPTIWDWLYQATPPFGSFLVVQFEDGSRVAGVFAQGSMALTSPERQGIYLISEWQLDDRGVIVDQVEQTGGILVPSTASIRWIRILKGEADGDQEQRL